MSWLLNQVTVQYFLSEFAYTHVCSMHYIDKTVVSVTVSEILKQQNVTMHAAGLIRLAHGPAVMHEPSIHCDWSSMRWWSPAARAPPINLAPTKYDTFMMSAYYREYGLAMGYSTYQIHGSSIWLMQNCYSFQHVDPLMSCPFSDLWTEGYCRSLNAFFF